MNEKNGRLAHRRMVAGQGILTYHGRNNNSPATGVSARAFIQRLWKVILVQEIVVPTENPIRVKPLKSAIFKKMKRMPRELDNQNVTLLHRGGILRNHGQNSNSP